jgi:hypothetical protein
MPTYWSAVWCPASESQTLGIICDPKHPALAGFPTAGHSDWQWYDLVTHSKVFVLNDVPPDRYTAVIRSISDFHQNNQLVPVFETKVGAGRLLVCGFDLSGDLAGRPAARQLLAGLKNYVGSEKFRPSATMPLEMLKKMLDVPPRANIIKTGSSVKTSGEAGAMLIENIDKAVLDVQAAINVPSKNLAHEWKAEFDRVNVKKQGFDYRPLGAIAWKDDSGAAWAATNLGLRIKCPVGFHGKCYVHFHDWNSQNRRFVGEFESQRFSLGKHSEAGVWTVFKVIREDALDGKLELSSELTSGPNVMITHVVLVSGEE